MTPTTVARGNNLNSSPQVQANQRTVEEPRLQAQADNRVIDELAGQWLACAFAILPFGGWLAADTISLPAFALAFLLFRLFDIWKPWPVSWADSNLKGGIGVMTDDMIAGLMAGILVALARHFGLP